MNHFSFIQTPQRFYFKEPLFEFWKSSKNRIVFVAIAIIGIFGLCYGFLRFICFKAKKEENTSKILLKTDQKITNLQESTTTQSKEKNLPFSPFLTTLKNGYAMIPFLEQKEIQNLFTDLKHFDLQSQSYKEQFCIPGQIEIGYSSLKNKNVFVIRNQKIPAELHSFMPYIATVHAIAIQILEWIEKDLELEEDQLTQTASQIALPPTKNSTSLLRLFAYAASSEEGMAADEHEDLGLLTIIPCSEVPALEVLSYQQNCEWVNIEKKASSSQAIILVGKTLEQMTKGKYIAATHRVKNTSLKRFSIVYQLRAEPNTRIFVKNEMTTVDEWLTKLKKNLTSINGSY